jgi:outer membrane protein assembly factor BamB
VVVVATGERLVALAAPDGKPVWEADLEGETVSSPVAGELDGDGILDVAIGTEDGRCLAFSGKDGHLMWIRRTGDRISGRPAIGGSPAGKPPVVVAGSCDGLVHAWDGSSGRKLWMQAVGGPIDWSSPTLWDLDGDGWLDVVVGSHPGGIHAISGAPRLR